MGCTVITETLQQYFYNSSYNLWAEQKERIAYIEKYPEKIFSVEYFLLHQDLLQCFMLTLAEGKKTF